MEIWIRSLVKNAAYASNGSLPFCSIGAVAAVVVVRTFKYNLRYKDIGI